MGRTLRRSADLVRYARVTSGAYAGTVTVALVGSRPDGCDVEVTYDLTALSEEGASMLEDRFFRHYDAAIGEWATAIDATEP